ncbi:hypothetical protein ZWY2020_007349 [Hordeum vulgare]|nr:hypothetical protein ZWY2020_007349 [Hordeum vulgare]
MPFCKEKESSDEDICMVFMDQQLFVSTSRWNRDRFRVRAEEDGSFRRFFDWEALPGLSCAAEDEGVNCGVVEWVDDPWPEILQRCLARLWEMYQEHNFGRVKDQQAHDKEVVKLKKEIDFLSNNYSQLVEDVSKLFDYQDGKMSHDMDYTSQAINQKKKELEDQARIEISMEKLKLAKEQRVEDGGWQREDSIGHPLPPRGKTGRIRLGALILDERYIHHLARCVGSVVRCTSLIAQRMTAEGGTQKPGRKARSFSSSRMTLIRPQAWLHIISMLGNRPVISRSYSGSHHCRR